MGNCICKNRIRNERGVIIGYVIQDTQTKIENVYNASYMKSILASGKLNVQNLTLTSDGRIIMSDTSAKKSNIPTKRFVKTKSSSDTVAVGQKVTLFLHSLLLFDYDNSISNTLKCTDFNPDDKAGSFTLLVNPSLLGLDESVELKFKYKSVVSKYRNKENTYNVGVVIRLISVGSIRVSNTDKLNIAGMLYDTVSGRLRVDIPVRGQELITFIKNQCLHLVKTKKYADTQQLRRMISSLSASFEKKGIKFSLDMIQILCCIKVLVGKVAQKQYVEDFNKVIAPYGLKVVAVKSNKDIMNTKQVTFSNNLVLQFQQPEIDIKALDIVMKYKVKKILVIDRQAHHEKSTVVCLDLDNPNIGFVSSKALLNSLVDNKMVNVANMEVDEIGVDYQLKVDSTIRDFQKQFLFPPFPAIVKAGEFYVLIDIVDKPLGRNTFTVPEFVNFIALGDFHGAVYSKRIIDSRLQIINSKAVTCDILNAKIQ